jgi:hypothetical protein
MKSTAERRNRRLALVASAALAVAAIGTTAGCAAQTELASSSTGAAAVPSASSTSPAATRAGQTATTPASTQASHVAATPEATQASRVVAAPAKSSAAKTATPAATKSQTATSSRPVPGLEDCGVGAALVRPASLILACADDGLFVKDLKWSNWSGNSATATGTMTWHVCTPSCAQSTQWDSTTAQVTLIDPVSESGKVLFTKVVLRLTGTLPTGFQRESTFNMAPTSF